MAPEPFEDVVEDTRYGAITVAGEPGTWVQVSGPAVPTGRIERRPGTARDQRHAAAPVGTRDAGLLSATLGGAPVRLEVGPGRLLRRSYRVTGAIGDAVLTLSPRTPYSSRVLRGRRGRRRHDLGLATRAPSGGVGIAWAGRDGADGPTAPEAALAYLLAGAFDTGAELAVVQLVTEGPDLLFPG